MQKSRLSRYRLCSFINEEPIMKTLITIKTWLKENALNLLFVVVGLFFLSASAHAFLGLFVLGFAIGRLINPDAPAKRLWHTGIHIALTGLSALAAWSVRKAVKKGKCRA